MIITDKFVILNFPKTGSTFVREVVRQLYHNRANHNLTDKLLRKFGFRSIGYRELLRTHPSIPNYKDQHGGFYQIPNKDQQKQIVSVVRNPYNRFDSQYRFKWWAQHPPLSAAVLKTHFPSFPEINIDEYALLRKLVSADLKIKYQIAPDIEIGDQTIQFMEMFFKNPKEVFKNLSVEYISNGAYKKDLCNLKLLQQEDLNEQLIQFLALYGFTESELSFIREHEKVNVTQHSESSQLQLTENTVSYIKTHEWILLKILSDMNIRYHPPI